MKPSTTPLDPESWHHNDANLRRAVQQWNGQLPTLPEGFAERMHERMKAVEVSTSEAKTHEKDTGNGAKTQRASTTPKPSAPQKRSLWPWWSTAAAVVAITAMLLWTRFYSLNDQQALNHHNQQVPLNPTSQQTLSTSDLRSQQALSPNSLKGQQALSPNGLKGQQAHSPGQRPGYQDTNNIRPERAKALTNHQASALTGRENPTNTDPGRRPGLTVTSPFQGVATDKMAQTMNTQDGPSSQAMNTQDKQSSQTSNTQDKPIPHTEDIHVTKQPHPTMVKPDMPPSTHSRKQLAVSLHVSSQLTNGHTNSSDVPALAENASTMKADNYYFLAGNGFTYMNYSSVKAESYTLNNNAVTINNSHHDLPLTVGLTINIPLNERWSAETGFTFTSLRSTFGHGNTQEYRHIHQRISYIGIPVQLQYSFILTRALRLYALGGLQVDFPLSAEQNWQRINNGHTSAEGTEHPSVPVQLSPIGGLGAQLNVTRHLSIFCQPSLQWFIPTSEHDGGPGIQTYRTEHELAFSLPFGLRWTM